MRISHNLDVVLDGIARSLSETERRVLPQALPRAINRVATMTRTQAVREVSQRMGTRRKPVRDAMTIIRAKRGHAVATIRVRGAPLPLSDFSPRQTRRGVTAKAWGQRKLYRGAFLAPLGGKERPAKRAGNRRTGPPHFGELPVRQLYGPSPVRVMREPVVQRLLRRFVGERLPDELRRQLAYYSRR